MFITKKRLRGILNVWCIGSWKTLDELRSRMLGMANDFSQCQSDKYYLLEYLKAQGLSESGAFVEVAKARIKAVVEKAIIDGSGDQYPETKIDFMPKSDIDRAIDSLRSEFPGWGFRRCCTFPGAWRVIVWAPGIVDHKQFEDNFFSGYVANGRKELAHA